MPIGCCCPSTCAFSPAACACCPAGCACCPCACAMVSLPEIENGEDEYPDQIDEVPVQAHGFDDLVVAFPAGHEPRSLAIEVAAHDLDRHDDEEDDADRHVSAVKAGDHE